MRKLLKVFTVLLVSGLIFQGCAASKSNTQSSNEQSAPLAQDTKAVEKDEQKAVEKDTLKNEQKKDIQRIGQPNYGFVDIPSNWVKFKDVDVTEPILQYSDSSGKSIITLNAYKKNGTNAKTVASGLYKKVESEGAKNIKGATVKLGGNTAYQVYGLYPADKTILVMWVFETSDDYIHYVSAESPEDSILELVKRTENSFSLDK